MNKELKKNLLDNKQALRGLIKDELAKKLNFDKSDKIPVDIQIAICRLINFEEHPELAKYYITPRVSLVDALAHEFENNDELSQEYLYSEYGIDRHMMYYHIKSLENRVKPIYVKYNRDRKVYCIY